MSTDTKRCPVCSEPAQSVSASFGSVEIDGRVMADGRSEYRALPCRHPLDPDQFKTLSDALRPPWSWSAPTIPDHVPAVTDHAGWIWLRAEARIWALWRGNAGSGAYRIHEPAMFARGPLREVPDPREDDR